MQVVDPGKDRTSVATQPEAADAVVSIWQSANSLALPSLKDDFVAQEAINLRTLYLPNAETWVVVENEIPVGFIALTGNEIGGLFLDPSFHGQGLGSALVDRAADLEEFDHIDFRHTIGEYLDNARMGTLRHNNRIRLVRAYIRKLARSKTGRNVIKIVGCRAIFGDHRVATLLAMTGSFCTSKSCLR